MKRDYTLLLALLAIIGAVSVSIIQHQHKLDNVVWAEYVIQPGDTIWGLVLEHGPDGFDPRELVHMTLERNGIGAIVPVGQLVLIPVSK